jgi:hypothetical protein
LFTLSVLLIAGQFKFLGGLMGNCHKLQVVLGGGRSFGNSNSGSQAFHIGVVASVTPIVGTDLVDLDIGESSGGRPPSGGNGARVQSLGQVKAMVSKGLVWVPDGNNRT